jgi:Holliday junction resolvase RusA-like endonuclease
MPDATVSFFVAGEAKGKARPRFPKYRKGKIYTPDPDGWVALVTQEAIAARTDPAWAEYTGPVDMTISTDRAMPKGLSKKKRAARDGEPCLVVPDSVNVAAAVMDALNHVLYVDDKQVDTLHITQDWAEEHGTWITLRYEEVGA